MNCDKCKNFPVPTSSFNEIGVSIERHGTLYRCKHCGKYYEIIEGERSYNELDREEALKFYNVGA
jgi:RNase P subunit RPR2